MIGFATGPTWWLGSRWFPAFLVACIVGVSFIGIPVGGERVCSTSVVVIIVTSTFCVALGWVFSAGVDDTFFGSGLVFCSDDSSVGVLQDLDLWLVASQCLSAVHLWFPIHLTLTPVHVATQSIQRGHSSNESD